MTFDISFSPNPRGKHSKNSEIYPETTDENNNSKVLSLMIEIIRRE